MAMRFVALWTFRTICGASAEADGSLNAARLVDDFDTGDEVISLSLSASLNPSVTESDASYDHAFKAGNYERPQFARLADQSDGMCADASHRPIFIMHGIFSDGEAVSGLKQTIENNFPGRTVVALDIEDHAASLTTNAMDQVNRIISKLKVMTQDPIYDNGYDMVGHSQGALLLRGVISLWDDHRVCSFVSLAGPQQGQASLPPGVIDWLCESIPQAVCGLIKMIAGNLQIALEGPLARGLQKFFSVSGYLKIDEYYDGYVANSILLCVINNECTGTLADPYDGRPNQKSCQNMSCYNSNSRYQENFKRLTKVGFFISPDDGTISPWQSGMFDWADASAGTVDFAATPLGKYGLVPILEMGDKIVRKQIPGIPHADWETGAGFEYYRELLDSSPGPSPTPSSSPTPSPSPRPSPTPSPSPSSAAAWKPFDPTRACIHEDGGNYPNDVSPPVGVTLKRFATNEDASPFAVVGSQLGNPVPGLTACRDCVQRCFLQSQACLGITWEQDAQREPQRETNEDRHGTCTFYGEIAGLAPPAGGSSGPEYVVFADNGQLPPPPQAQAVQP